MRELWTGRDLPSSVMRTRAGPRPNRLQAILRQRCPRCREGKIFRGPFRMNWFCPVCELRFVREPGYTTVAIEVSYLFSIPLLLLFTALVWVLTAWPLEWVVLTAAFLYVPLSPAVFRYARVLWIHFDQAVDPGR